MGLPEAEIIKTFIQTGILFEEIRDDMQPVMVVKADLNGLYFLKSPFSTVFFLQVLVCVTQQCRLTH